MRRILFVFCVLGMTACSDNDGGGTKDQNPDMRGTFASTAEMKTELYVDKCVHNAPGDMDSRLQAGMSFAERRVDKNFGEEISISNETKTLESVDHDQNFFVARHDLDGNGPQNAWIVGKTQFTFGDGWGGSQMEIIKASPNLQKLIAESEKNQENEKWWSCMEKFDGTGTSESKAEEGTFTLADGKTVTAQRKTDTRTGTIECMHMQSQDGQAPKELERKEMGKGSVIMTTIMTADVPSTDTQCGGRTKSLYYRYETKLETGEILTLTAEELVGYR